MVAWIAAVAAKLSVIDFVIYRQMSFIDKAWSIVPALYLWIYAAAAHFAEERLVVAACLATLWSIRLTGQAIVRGYYKRSHEDYRWPLVRKWLGNNFVAELVFAIVFVGLYQSALLAALAAPGLAAYEVRGVAWDAVKVGGFGTDSLAFVLWIAFFMLEAIADSQQAAFFSLTREERASVGGFNRAGLFSLMRHPAWVGEQGMWYAMALFAVGPMGGFYEARLFAVGAAALSGLMVGSAFITEKISASKYPDYALYQREVPCFIPGATFLPPAFPLAPIQSAAMFEEEEEEEE
jgi:steroid 5-alpha reductase family enzyme